MLVAERGPVNRCEIVVGDALDTLREMPDESVQCCVTSPPYWGLRDYGVPGQLGLEPTFGEWLVRVVEIFEEVRRVLRKDGTCWVNMGDSHCSGTGVDRMPTTTRGRRVPASWSNRAQPQRTRPFPGVKAKDLLGQPWRLAFALQDAGWYLRSDIIWAKPNPMPESATDRPTKAHEYLFLLTKSARYYYDADAIRTPLAPKTYTTFGCGPGSPKGNDGLGGVKAQNWADTVPQHKPRMKRPDGWASHEGAHGSFHRDGRESGGAPVELEIAGANARTVWTIATSPFPEAHFATFPPELPRRCILAGSRPGDLVLDPFSGAGTTGLVSNRLGRDFVGIELNPQYAAMARRRIAADAPLFNERSEP